MAVQKWTDYQADKVKRAFDVLEAAPPALDPVPNVGHDHARLCARLSGPALRGKWRGDYPKLVKWLDEFEAKVPAFGKTRVTA